MSPPTLPTLPTLLFLPGVGGDERLFGPQLAAFPGARVVPWVTPEAGDTLVSYARRLAATVDNNGDAGPFVVVGNSLGGMVAWELAAHLNLRAVVLLGSASSLAAVRAPLRLLLPLGRLVLPWMVPWLFLGGPVVAAVFGVRWRDLGLFIDMMRKTPPAFFAFALRAIASWKPSPPPAVPVFRVHGSRDWVLSPGEGATLIAGAGHVPGLSHGDEVNEALKRVLAKVLKEPPARVEEVEDDAGRDVENATVLTAAPRG